MALRYGSEFEPFQEVQGQRSGSKVAHEQALNEYYRQSQKQDEQRKLSRTGSLFRRKSSKRTSAAPTPKPPKPLQPPPVQRQRSLEEKEMQAIEEKSKLDRVPMPYSPRSVVPETISELPAWYAKDHWANTASQYAVHYPIHNPVGPMWYKNHHLIPPSQTQPKGRPPSFFSTSFPPMASSSSHGHIEDSTQLAGPSRTPSNSPLPTPSSSQVRVTESGANPRSRKTSQTAADNVDLLDGTDPWGQNFHHQSPYDISPPSAESGEAQTQSQSRSRHSSTTGFSQNRHRTVTPSPLSQSTSAIHLQVDMEKESGSHIPRKLSKRHTPIAGVFGNRTAQAASAPSTPVQTVPSDEANKLPLFSNAIHKRMSRQQGPPPSTSASFAAASKKEKRGSVIGRLAKKLSIIRKPPSEPSDSRPGSRMLQENDWQHVAADDAQSRPVSQQVPIEKPPVVEPIKRIPPPSIPSVTPTTGEDVTNKSPTDIQPPAPPQPDRYSISSFEEAPFSVGNLTVANPDLPSAANTPVQPSMTLPSPAGVSHLLSFPIDDGQTMLIPNANPPPDPSFSSNSYYKTSEPAAAPSHARRSPSPQKLAKAAPTEKRRSEDKRRSNSPKKEPSKRVSDSPVPDSTQRLLASALTHHVFPGNGILPPNSNHSAANGHSPASASSVIANPPTPGAGLVAELPRRTPSPLPPPVPTKSPPPMEKKRDPSPRKRDPSPGGVSRKTETFKLVRSASGTVYSSTETIQANGEQWEVVESAKKSEQSGSPSQPADKGKRRESRKPVGRSKDDAESSSQRKHQSVDVSGRLSKGNHVARASSVDTQFRTPIADSMTQSSSSTPSRRRSDRERERGRSSANTNKPHPKPPSPSPTPNHGQLERSPSSAARPTSDIPSAAEFSDLRAKEAWDMERLWKGRSMHGENELEAPPIPPKSEERNLARRTSTQTHGSSHTSFVIQTPFQPPAQPSQGSRPRRLSKSNEQNADSPAEALFSSRVNPLPEPPRESPFKTALNDKEATSAQYWAQYSGMTPTH